MTAEPRPCYCQRGDAPMVAVPATGEWLVRGGKVTEVTGGTCLDTPGAGPDEEWARTVYTKECL